MKHVCIRAMAVLALVFISTSAFAQGKSPCAGLPTEAQLRELLKASVGHGGDAGGLFHGTRMWASVVNREGELCGSATSTEDSLQVWLGSLAISKAKAFTANAFSLDGLALSSAMLYTFTQPGHSLWSLGQSNLFNPNALQSPLANNQTKTNIAGGLIFFGGGVPLYSGGKLIGGLGISGDTSCADHEIAKRVRDLAGLNPAGGMLADDIRYETSQFNHPQCLNTYKNGQYVGEEKAENYSAQD